MNLSVILFIIAAITPFFILTLWALINVSVKTFPGRLREKVIWWLIALIPFIGWLIYLIFGFRRGKRLNIQT
ncbi:MAG: PLDc N-terminal domain-containing protein [Desulfobacteraceae bacterium]|nr:PLDc N-terminal domain-containing protein [Desulfobacteraceae bacterium]